MLLQVASVVVDHIGVFEYLAACHDFVDAFFEEIQLAHRILFHFVELLDDVLDSRQLLFAYFTRFGVVHVALEAEDVPISFHLRCLLVLKHLGKLLVVVELPLVHVAGIVPVDFPDGEAEPAELVVAFLTDHAIASLVLFDEGAAIRAGLGVGFDPEDIWALVFFLEGPCCNLLARARLVILYSTFDAK